MFRGFRWIVKGLALTLLFSGARLQAGSSNITDISFTAQALNGTWCPGDPVNVSFQICDTNQYYMPTGAFDVFLQSATFTASCALPNQGDPLTWLAVGVPGAVNPPTHNWGNWGSAPVYPGYNAAMNTTATCKPFSFNFNLPADLTYGQSYRLFIILYESNISQTGSCGPVQNMAMPLEYDFTACQPSSSNSVLLKSVEGTPTQGEIMLYWLDYNFLNSTGNVITDTLPGCLSILRAEPNPFDGTPAGVAGQTVTWHVPDATVASTPIAYRSQGRVWVEVSVPAGCANGTVLSNTAHFTQSSGPGGSSNTVTQTVGSINVTLVKSQLDNAYNPVSTVKNGATVNYVLQYQFSGSGLRCYDSFNSYGLGTYIGAPGAPSLGSGGTWMNDNSASQYGWAVKTDGGGDQYVQYQGTSGDYGQLWFNCPAAEANGQDVCGNVMVESDVRIDGNASTGDTGIVLRSNDQVGGSPNYKAYVVIMSIDNNPGNLALQKNVGSSPSWPATWPGAGPASPLAPVRGIWYTIKALELHNDATCTSTFYIKYWQRGTPEPTAWMINGFTDTDCSFNCGTATDGITWRPGLAGQADLMSYDNFRVFSSSSLSSSTLATLSRR